MMAKKPEDRFQQASQVVAALKLGAIRVHGLVFESSREITGLKRKRCSRDIGCDDAFVKTDSHRPRPK